MIDAHIDINISPIIVVASEKIETRFSIDTTAVKNKLAAAAFIHTLF